MWRVLNSWVWSEPRKGKKRAKIFCPKFKLARICNYEVVARQVSKWSGRNSGYKILAILGCVFWQQKSALFGKELPWDEKKFPLRGKTRLGGHPPDPPFSIFSLIPTQTRTHLSSLPGTTIWFSTKIRRSQKNDRSQFIFWAWENFFKLANLRAKNRAFKLKFFAF